MKLAAAAVVVVLAGCTDGYDVWVTYTPDLVSVRMFTSSCDLGIDFPAPGQCHSWNDGGTTEPRCTSVIEMQACTDNAHLEKDGVTVATGGLGFANPPPADVLVIDGCSKPMRIPLPALPAPPMITAFDGTNVSWRLQGLADRVEVNSGTGFVGSICGQSPSTTTATLPDPHGNSVSVVAWTKLVTTDVALGEAHVRAGAGSASSL